MKLEVFEKIITQIKSQQEQSHKLYQLGIDLMEYEDAYAATITLLFRAYYGKDGEDWISWFIYERDDESDDPNQAWDKDNNPICYDIPSLWKCVEEIRCSTDFVEYSIETSKLDIFNSIFGRTA